MTENLKKNEALTCKKFSRNMNKINAPKEIEIYDCLNTTGV